MKAVDLKVPNEDRSALLAPPGGELVELVAINAKRIAGYDFAIAGRPFRSFRAAAREEILALARDYTAAMGVKVADAPHDLLVETGHQPEFVHPGIWIKNHLCDRIARAAGGVGLNLVVDNDAPPSGSMPLPVRRPDGFQQQQVTFAEVDGSRAWEEHDEPGAWRFEDFARDVAMLAWPDFNTPVFRRYLEDLPRWLSKARNLPHLLTVLRRRYEEHAGVSNLEIPASMVCRTRAFARFVLALAVDAERFVREYNAALAEYRRFNDIHSPMHPMPDLAVEGHRRELPFWIWRPHGARTRLHVDVSDGLALTLGGKAVFRVDGVAMRRLSSGDADAFDAEAMRLLEESEGRFKVRPRALATTVFSRIFLSDVFVHGVGGAKYDAIADEIVGRYFGVEAPGYAACSATLYLPIDVEGARRNDVRRLCREIRDIRFNPERHLDGKGRADPCVEKLVRRKKLLIARSRELRERAGSEGKRALRDERREVFLAIREENAELVSLLSDRVDALETELQRVRVRIEDQAVVHDRGYSFILYPERQVLDFYDEVLRI